MTHLLVHGKSKRLQMQLCKARLAQLAQLALLALLAQMVLTVLLALPALLALLALPALPAQAEVLVQLMRHIQTIFWQAHQKIPQLQLRLTIHLSLLEKCCILQVCLGVTVMARIALDWLLVALKLLEQTLILAPHILVVK
jgi:hypothetical protein